MLVETTPSRICAEQWAWKKVRKRDEERADPISGTGSFWKWGRINYYKSVKP